MSSEIIHDVETISRSMLWSDQFDNLKKIRETLQNANVHPDEFLRTIPLGSIVKDFASNTMRAEIPGLRQVYPTIKETLSISPSLAQLKIADTVAEGTEAYGYWKDVWGIETMNDSKLSIPRSSSDNLITDLNHMKATDGAPPPIVMGGEIDSVTFDVTDNKGYYRAGTSIKRNWLADNNFRALEVHLKQIGEAIYYAVGKFLASEHITASGTTDTKANLDGASNTLLEALINVVNNKLPASRYTGDSIIIHPADHYATIVEQWGVAGPLPAIDQRLLGDGKQSFREVAFAGMLGLKNAYITPWMTENTVLIFKKDASFKVGLRQDLEFEDFGEKLMGLTNSVMSMRFDQQECFDKATFKITTF